jgi:hypothetical protein
MTKNDTNAKKLILRRESLRELTTADLEKVAGGPKSSVTTVPAAKSGQTL